MFFRTLAIIFMNSSLFKTLIHSVLLGKIYFTYLSSFQCTIIMVGLSGLEPPTSRLSGVRSNQLSYRPIKYLNVNKHSKLNTICHVIPHLLEDVPNISLERR